MVDGAAEVKGKAGKATRMARLLKGGHTDSVLCVESRENSLVSGGEGGELCIWDTRTEELTHKGGNSGESCTSIALPQTKPDNLYASFGDTIKDYDVRNFALPVCELPSCDDEINQIVLNAKEDFLGACDDTGNIKVFTVRASENKVFKTLRNKHSNICSSVTFRAGKPWDLVSSGFDFNLIHWDFAKLKVLNMFNMQEIITDVSMDSVNYLLNPPFVHHVNMNPDGGLIGCGLGNGGVLLMDSSKRHLKRKQYYKAHSQGVSQVHFIDTVKFVTGSNDEQIFIWDLSRSSEEGEGNPGQDPSAATPTANGHGSNPVPDLPSAAEQVICHRIDHKFKVNWLKPTSRNGSVVLAVADQRGDITLYDIP